MEWHVSLEVREKKFWTLELFFMLRSTPFFCKVEYISLVVFLGGVSECLRKGRIKGEKIIKGWRRRSMLFQPFSSDSM
jgi:hypothetical protein